MTNDRGTDDRMDRCWPLPLAVAVVAFVTVVSTLDSSGAVPELGEGPGLTLDEVFNVQMGVYHVRMIGEYGLALLHPDSIREVFGNPTYNPDHPPLGRLLLGVAHELSFPLLTPDVPPGHVCVTCARLAAAAGFAVTVLLIGWMTARWYGRGAGFIAALSMVLMPRLFSHAHLASLETFVSLTYVAAVLWVAATWRGERPPPWRHVLIGGVLFGLCLLTKIQGVLLPVPIGLWALWQWRWRAVLPMLVFGLTGLAVFFVGWPWLWLDPTNHLAEYFSRATERQTLYCWYMNTKWADTDVPWHYPFVLFFVTVPIGLHILGCWGATAGCRQTRVDPRTSPTETVSPPTGFLLLNVAWPLAFFALPRITVYDGTRLFLMVFPLWAIFIGRGGASLFEVLQRRWNPRVAIGLVALLMAAQSVGLLRMHPLGLSYYNGFVGGLRGAAALGFESTYWGDSVTRSLLAETSGIVDEGGTLDIAPVLHPFQLEELLSQSPALRSRSITLRAYDDGTGADIRTVLVIRRRADSWPALTPEPDGEVRAEVERDGVQLTGVYELP